MSMLNLVLVQTFLAIAESRSFHEAARRLGIAQPTVSLHLQKLEEQLGGVALIERSRSGCSLTTVGHNFRPYAEHLMRLNTRAIAAVQSHSMRIGASSNIGIYLLPTYLRSFIAIHEHTSHDVVIDKNPAIAERLETGELDFALMEWWDHREGFLAHRWREEPLVVIVPPSHHWASRTEIHRSDLHRVDLIGGESGTGTGRLLLDYFKRPSEMPVTRVQLGSTEAVKEAVKAEFGISIVLEASVQEEVRYGSLVAIPLSDPPLRKDLWIIWRPSTRQGAQPPFVRHLAEARPKATRWQDSQPGIGSCHRF